jgi:2',3'-cyclic-nucleotide 2'-phosphodiesterase
MHAKAQNEERTRKVLFFGDVIGKPGRKALLKVLPELRAKYNPDFVIVNVENLAHGKGVTVNTMEELAGLEIDAYTSGNHIFDKGELTKEAFEKYPNLLRPSNYKGDFPGRGYVRIEKAGQGYLIINLNATVFFEKQFRGEIGNPFLEFDRIIEEQKRPGDIVFVDFHSEATSEKKVFGFYVDGRATLVCGTHTHVPTADLRILPKGTAHVSDVGMIGALNSVLGVPVQNSLEIFMGGKFTFEVEESNPIMLNAVFVEARNGLAVKAEKIYQEVDV